MKLLVKRLDPRAAIPEYAFMGDAGADLVIIEGKLLEPGQGYDFPIGLAMEPPLGYFYLIHPRSSTLRKRGLYVHPGIIDNGYRGPLYVYVRNENKNTVHVEAGARLAQIIMLPMVQPQIVLVDELSESDRGGAGFGSTGASSLTTPSPGAQS